MFGAILKATNSYFQTGMTFCRSIYVKKAMKLLAFIFEQPLYQQQMLLKVRKPILKYTLNKYHVHWLSSFKHLNLPISIKIPVTIWQIVYIYMTTKSPYLIL